VNKARVQITAKTMLLFFLIATLIISAGPTVTCFGEDGHVKVEFAPANCCEPSSDIPTQVSRTSYTNTAYVASTNSCGSCIDVPTLANGVTRSFAPISKKTSSLKVLPATTISILNDVGPLEGFIAKPESPINSTLASIRTTVLII